MSVENAFLDRWGSLFTSLNGYSKDSIRSVLVQEDSILLSHQLGLHSFNKLILKQGSKLMYDSDSFSEYLSSKLPTTVFFMLPFFALCVKLVYWRKGYYYIDHLVHIFHIHSFIFLLITVFSIGVMLGISSEIPHLLISILVMVYLFQSMRVVYLQRRWTSILSVAGLGMVHLALVAIFY